MSLPEADRSGSAEPSVPFYLQWWFRLAISALLLTVLVWKLGDVNAAETARKIRDGQWGWALLGLGAQALAIALQSWRWSAVLRLIDRPLALRRLFSYTFAGQFVSNVLPTAFGGDVIRIARAGRDLSDTPTAFASVALERLVGWLVLPMISIGGFALSATARANATHARAALILGIATAAALIAMLIAAAALGVSDHDRGWRGYLAAVRVGVLAMRRHPTRLASVLVAGSAFQLVLCVSVWALAQALGLVTIDLPIVMALYPAVAIAQNLPVGIGGLGVREGAFTFFFAGILTTSTAGGSPNSALLALSLMTYVATVAVSALGAPALAGRGPARPRS